MNSFFENIDPLNKFLWVLIIGISLLFFKTPSYGILIFLSILVVVCFGTKLLFKNIWKKLLLIFMIPSCLFIFHLIIQPGDVLLDLHFINISKQGLKIGVLYFFRFSSVIFASMLFILTTDIRKFMVGLVQIGLPYQLAFVIFLMLRFIPIMSEELSIIRSAYKVRGFVRLNGFKKTIFLWKRYLFTSIVKGIRLAEKTSTAMESRAFNAYKKRTFITEFKWSISGILMNILYIFVTFIFLIWFNN